MSRRRLVGLFMLLMSAFTVGVVAQTLELLFTDYTGETAYDVVVGEGYAYVSNNVGVSIYDIRDPENARLLTPPDWTGGGVFDLSLEGTTLYAAAPGRGSLIVDVSDPSTPMILSLYNAPILAVHHDIAYSGGIHYPFQLVDVSDTTHPRLLTELDWIGIRGVVGTDGYAFAAHPTRGVIHLDVSDPENPVELSVLRNTIGAYKLEIREATLAIAMYTRGIMAWNISNPRYPTATFGFSDTGEAWDISSEYPIFCVADLEEGVEVIDASAPFMDRLIVADPSWAPHSLYFEDGLVHLADQDEGYVLLRLHLEDESED